MIATWEPEPNLEPSPLTCGSPRLPAFAAPRPLVLPASDVLGFDRLSSVEELSGGEPASPEGSIAEERVSYEDRGLAHAGSDEHPSASRSFQRLLVDLAMEHKRELAQLQAQLKAAAAPLPDRELPEVSEKASENGQAAALEAPMPRKGSMGSRRSNANWQDGEVAGFQRNCSGSAESYLSIDLLDQGQGSQALMPRGNSNESKQRQLSRKTSPPAGAEGIERASTWTSQSSGRAAHIQTARSSPFDLASVSSAGTGASHTKAGDLVNRLRRSASMVTAASMCKKLVASQAFDTVSGLAIVLNSALLGWAANYSIIAAAEGKPPDMLPSGYRVLTVLFTVWFTVELLLKMLVLGCRKFFTKESGWNIFDTVVVGSDLVHSMLELFSVDVADGLGIQNLTVVRMLRILRITRVIRVVRLIRFFRELRMMVFSVLRSGASLLWSCLLLAVTIYIFGVYFCQIVAFHIYHNITEDPSRSAASTGVFDRKVLLDMFGSLLQAEYVLYQAVSGGINWGEIGRQVIAIHPFHGFALAFFIFYTSFALLNIITGIFVDTATTSAQSDKDELIQEQMHQTTTALKEMKRIFASADVDESGSLTAKEFEVHLENKEVKAHLCSLGIEVNKAKGLFRLLDLDMSGEVTIEEFVEGCMRLKGNAKSVDLATLMYENIRLYDDWRSFAAWSEKQFQALQETEQRIADAVSRFLGEETLEELVKPAPQEGWEVPEARPSLREEV